MIDLSDDLNDFDDDVTQITFACIPANYDKIVLASDALGETRTDAINRAMAFYFELAFAMPGRTITWTELDGTQRELRIKK